MNTPSPILLPTIALAAWTMVIWFWMYLTRIPAIYKMKMRLDPNAKRGEQMSELPAKVRWKADNYNHLMEQPTVFYPVAIILALIGAGEGFNVTLAWMYVGIRVLHSLVQVLNNHIMIRWVLFVFSSLVLIAMIINALRVLL